MARQRSEKLLSYLLRQPRRPAAGSRKAADGTGTDAVGREGAPPAGAAD